MAYIIGILQAELSIPMCNSLKEKRGILRSMENHLRKKLNISVSEIDEQDRWQTSIVGIVTGSSDRVVVDQTLHRAVSLMDQETRVDVVDFEIEIL